MDRPHNVSIVFSFLAILLSLVSLWQSCENAKFAKVSSRADVQITQMRYRVPELFIRKSMLDIAKQMNVVQLQKYLSTHPFTLEGTIVNFGKTRAIKVTISAINTKEWTDRDGLKLNGSGDDTRVINLPDLAPTRSQPVYFVVDSYEYPVDHMRTAGVLNYIDEATGVTYHERWCYQSKVGQLSDDFAVCSERLPNPPPLERPR